MIYRKLIMFALFKCKVNIFKLKMEEKRVVKEGAGLYKPNERGRVTIEVEGRLGDGRGSALLPRQTRELVLREADDEATEAIEGCIRTMRVGEVAEFTVGNGTLPGPPIELVRGAQSPQSPVWYSIRLVSSTRAKESWRLSTREKLEVAGHHKAVGNERFKAGNHSVAGKRYSKALKYLISINPVRLSDEERDQVKQLKVTCLSNLAASQLKLKIFHYANTNCSKVLEADPDNLKALYRRGQALMFMNDYDSARVDLERAQRLDPSSRAVSELLRELSSREQQKKRHYHQALKSMFGGK